MPGYPVIGTDQDIERLLPTSRAAHVTVGQIGDATPRLRLFRLLKSAGAILPAICASTAYVSARAHVGEGSIVMHGSIVNAGARIGINTIVNSGALVEHGAVVGDHCHVSTGVRLKW